MAKSGGIITVKDIIESDALNIGTTFANEMKKADDAIAKTNSNIKSLADAYKTISQTTTNTQFLEAKKQEQLLNIQITNGLKQQTLALKEAEKVKQEEIKTNTALALSNDKMVKSQTQIVKLTSEEIVNQRILAKNADTNTLATSKLAGAYRNLSAQVAIASEKYQNIIARGRTAEQTQRQFNKEVNNAQREFRVLQNRVLEADKAVDKWNRTGERSIGFAKNLLGAFGITGGITLFAQITQDIFNTTKEIQSLDMGLKQVTDTQANFAQQQLFIKDIATRYGIEINGLTKQFTQFYVSAKDKISGTEIQNIFESITKAGASMGLSVQSQERAFLALNQMMSKGTIQAEELRGQLGEALPGAFGIMAKAVGVTEKELAKMMKAGDLIASEVLPKFAIQLEKTYNIQNVKNIDNIVNAQNRLSNAWVNFVRQLNEGDGVLQKILSGTFSRLGKDLERFTEFLKSDAQKRKEYLVQLRADSKQNTTEFLDAKFKTAEEKEKYANDKIIEINAKQQRDTKKVLDLIAENKNNFYEKNQEAFNNGTFSKETEKQYISYKKNREEIIKLNDALTRRYGILSALKEQEIKPEVKEKKQENADEKAKREQKQLKDAYDLRKKSNEDSYKLSQARLQSAIELEDEITQNEKLNLQERLDASSESDQLALAKRQETFEYDLKNRGVYNEKTGKFERELTDAQINEILRGGDIVNKLNNEQLLTYETYQNDITKINKKGAKERENLTENDAKKQAENADRIFQEKLKQLNDIEEEANKIYTSQAIILEKRLNSGAITQKEYDKALIKLKNDTANQIFERQTTYFEEELLALATTEEQKLALVDAFAKIRLDHANANADAENKISEQQRKSREKNIKDSSKIIADAFGTDATNLENFFNNIYSNFDKLLNGGKLSVEDFTETFASAMAVVKDIGNVLFEKRISDIDYEIQKNNEFYDAQIALAENDARKKDLLEKEKKRKDDALEKQKRAEQHKQAVFNKAVTIAQIGLQTSLAIITAAAATAPTFWGVIIASTIGALQLAAAAAIPIPKYKLGRTGGKRERAIINEEVPEVVTGKGGVNPRIYEGKNALVDLMEGDMVHTSVDAYKKYMRSNSLQKVTIDNRRMDTYQASMIQSKSLDKEILDEMRMSRKAFEKNKPNINFSSQKVDINHELWKMQILNWKN